MLIPICVSDGNEIRRGIEANWHQYLAKYGNLFAIYDKFTGEDPYNQPMRIYPAINYTMGGTWVDYNLSNIIKEV